MESISGKAAGASLDWQVVKGDGIELFQAAYRGREVVEIRVTNNALLDHWKNGSGISIDPIMMTQLGFAGRSVRLSENTVSDPKLIAAILDVCTNNRPTHPEVSKYAKITFEKVASPD